MSLAGQRNKCWKAGRIRAVSYIYQAGQILFLLELIFRSSLQATLAHLGERKTEDLKAPCSIHGGRNRTFAISKVSLVKHVTKLLRQYINGRVSVRLSD